MMWAPTSCHGMRQSPTLPASIRSHSAATVSAMTWRTRSFMVLPAERCAAEAARRGEARVGGGVLDAAGELHGPVLGLDEVVVEVAVAQHHDPGSAVVGVEHANEALGARSACGVGVEGDDDLAGLAGERDGRGGGRVTCAGGGGGVG